MHTTKNDERGFASIVIALVLIIVLALFTVGFAQLARREQQTALDKQKATQAQYAAESGINNVYKDILAGKVNDKADGTSCLSVANPDGKNTINSNALTATPDINQTNGVSYSCAMVSLNTDNLKIDKFPPTSGRHMMFSTSANLTSLNIQWGSATGVTTPAPSFNASQPLLTSQNGWKYPAVIEFSITPLDGMPSTGNIEKYLVDNTFTFYGYPYGSGVNTVSYAPGSAGQVVSGKCSAGTGAYPCSVQLTGLGGKHFVIHMVDFYNTSNVLICANGSPSTTTCPTGSSVTFQGEPMIDVTGKARDVLKRIRVRLFIHGSSDHLPDDNAILPNNALEAQNICKRIQAAPPTAYDPQGSTYDGANIGPGGSTAPSCTLGPP